MTDDLISRQAAIDAVMKVIREGYKWQSSVSEKISLLNAVYCALEDIPSAQPTVDAVPVRHGHWIDMDEQSYTWKVRCSVCGHERSMLSTQGEYPNYCENCGARMDAERKEE